MAWLSGWAHRKKLTISNTHIAGDLAWYPLFFKFTGDADVAASAQASGNDVRFTEADGQTLLEYDQIDFEIAAGLALGVYRISRNGWVLPSASPTELYLYYGNAAALAGANGPAVYDASTVAFWHLGEAAAPYRDSTVFANHSSANAGNARAAGQLYFGQDFSGAANAYIRIPVTPSMNLATFDFSISYWAWRAALSGGGDIYRTYDGVKGWAIGRATGSPNPAITHYLYQPPAFPSIMNNAPWAAWFFVQMTCDRDNAAGFNAWMSNVGPVTGNPTSAPDVTATTEPPAIGNSRSDGFGVNNWKGVIEALRVSKTLRSSAWRTFEYWNEASVGNEITIGAEEDAAVVSGSGSNVLKFNEMISNRILRRVEHRRSK